MNCLEGSLLVWKSNQDMRLWYNSNHVVIIENEFNLDLFHYLPIEDFGFDHLVESFGLTDFYQVLLKEYFDQ
jgi:hypothetical protein